MAVVILDTNFLITCIKQKIYFEEQIRELMLRAEITVPMQARNELRKIAEGKSRGSNYNDRKSAELALQLISKFKEIKLDGKYADKGIINYCEKNNADKGCEIYVATIDEELIRKLKNLGAGIIRIRGKKRLVVE